MVWTYSNLFFKVPELAVTEEVFKNGWDLNKDGFLTMAELATVVFKQQLLGPIPNGPDTPDEYVEHTQHTHEREM